MIRAHAGRARLAAGSLRVLVLALLAVHLALSVAPALGTISNDFANYYVPARLVAAGAPVDRLYERNWLQNEIRRAGIDRLGLFVPNPPASPGDDVGVGDGAGACVPPGASTGTHLSPEGAGIVPSLQTISFLVHSVMSLCDVHL